GIRSLKVYGHLQVLLRMLLSLIINVGPRTVFLIDALPLLAGAIRQRSISAVMTLVSSSSRVMHPDRLMVPLPVIVNPPVPHLTNLYSPVKVLMNNTSPVTSSCKQKSKRVTLKLQETIWFAASVALQVTVVVPSEKIEPDGGVQTMLVAQKLST